MYMFFSEKTYNCYSFEVEKDGKLNELKEYNLKELRLATKSKPRDTNVKSNNFTSMSDMIIQNNEIVKENLITNELFNSLLSRGAVEILKNNRDIENSINRYMYYQLYFI